MKFLFNILLIILLACGLNSYGRNIDSLKKELTKATSAEAQSRILFGIGQWYDARDQFDTSLIYFKRAAQEARQAGNDSLLMEATAFTGYAIFSFNRLDEALLYYDTASAYARRLHMPVRLSRYLVMKCRILLTLARAAEMPPVMREALEVTQASHDKEEEAVVYRVLSDYYALLNNYSAELDYANKSLLIYDSLKMYNWVATAYRQISICYGKQEKYHEALRYALKADSTYIKIGEFYDRNVLKIQMATIYSELGDHQRAIKLDLECLDSFSNDSYAKRVIYSNLAVAQSRNGSFAEARSSFAKAHELNEQLNIPDADVVNYLQWSRACLKVSQLDSALQYAQLSESIARKIGINASAYMGCIMLLSDVYAAKGDMVSAHKYDRQFIELQDSVYQGILQSNLGDAEARFGVTEKNKELSELSAENELQKVKAQQQNLLNTSLVVGLCLGAVIVVLIITAYRRTLKKNLLLAQQKQELQQQKDIIDAQVIQLAGAAKMKSKFLANISHELRTPVTLLNGMLEIMSEKKQTTGVKETERLNIAYNNSRKLRQMVEEILDLTKLENNKPLPVYETKEIAPLLKRIVYAFETLIEKEHLELSYEDSAAAGYYVSIDTGKFEKVINNLMYNAIKFNRNGGYIQISAYPSADKKSLHIDVTDSGIGIAATDIPHIFEHFYQGATQGLKADGAGIGLSLVKEFTTLMGGTVHVSSKPGTGTTFSLQFGIAEQAANAERQPTEISEQPIEAWERFAVRPKLLIVEDNAEMRYYLQEVLGEKTDIATAANGIEALTWLEHNQPDLIISDVMMPGMDGRELVTNLKSQERFKKIPIITLTALAAIEDQLSFLRLGVDDYIVKPFNAEELRIRVYNLLANQAERRTFEQEPAEAGDVSADSKEAEEFRGKITEYVVARIKNINVSVADLASELFLSERQLYRLSKSLTGYTPAQLIKEIRLQKAYELLLSGNIYKIDDVCKRVGYEKTSYFSQQFFERFGKRPSEFL